MHKYFIFKATNTKTIGAYLFLKTCRHSVKHRIEGNFHIQTKYLMPTGNPGKVNMVHLFYSSTPCLCCILRLTYI